MTTAATPAEFERLMALLDPAEHLDRARKGAIARMVFEVVGLCPVCDEPIRRCDSRQLVDEDRLAHVGCLNGEAGE